MFRTLSPASGVLSSAVCAGAWLLTFATAEGASLTWWCGTPRATIARSVKNTIWNFVSSYVTVHMLGIFFWLLEGLDPLLATRLRAGVPRSFPEELECKQDGQSQATPS